MGCQPGKPEKDGTKKRRDVVQKGQRNSNRATAPEDLTLSSVVLDSKINRREDAAVLMFVDIDGVLNIGVKDPGLHAVSFTEANIFRAKAMKQKDNLAQKLMSVCSRQACDETSTYEDLCKGSQSLSDIFVQRLAQLIMVANARGVTTVVLSSSWRNQNMKGVRILEEILSKHMDVTFSFDATTAAEESSTPSGRLKNMGNFIKEWSHMKSAFFTNLHVLVLEDFHITPFDGWMVKGEPMTSVQDAEMYLHKCAATSLNTGVCILHTYDAWTTKEGMAVHVGSGLTMRHLCTGLAFLNDDLDIMTSPWATFARSITDPCENDATKAAFENWDSWDDTKDKQFERAVSSP